MCQLKSGLILKDRIFLPDYDSHTEMLEELKIEDNQKNAETVFVRAELYPKNGDVFSPIDTWIFHVDQDIVPDWYVEGYDEDRMRIAVKEWAKSHIHVGVDNLKISSGSNYYIKDCKNVEVYGSASIGYVCGSASISQVYDSASISRVCGSASIGYVCGSASISQVYGSASIGYVCGSASISEVCDSASISRVYDSASISRVCGSASISQVYGSASISRVYGSASISQVYGSASISEVKGNAVISSSPYGWRNKEKLIISENSTFKDNQTKTIWQSGDWTLKIVGERDE